MENRKINIENEIYMSISDLYFETKHYFLADQLDENLNFTDNYVFLLEEKEENNINYELIDDEKMKSILAKLFLPLIEKYKIDNSL